MRFAIASTAPLAALPCDSPSSDASVGYRNIEFELSAVSLRYSIRLGPMFERYTESARRVLFFARYEASQLGSISIETEHLLLGLIRECKGITSMVFARSHISLE